MATSFVENVNLLASKVDIVEEANSLFDENVIPVLEEIAGLDLDAAVEDLLKGNYLGNRKIDINLALNVQGITEELLLTDPDQAEAIWTDKSKTVQYDKAIITFTDGEVINLPFMFDNVPVTISTHGDLLAQLSRLDYTYAVAQVDSIFQVNVSNNTEYVITIDNVECKFTSPETAATKEGIIAGLANAVKGKNISVSAVLADGGAKLNLVAKVPGIPFFASTSANLTLTNVTSNVVEGPKETAFSAKLTGTLAANFAAPVVGEIVRLYDIIGQNSNIERIVLHAVSGKYIEEYTLFYWAKTTSAFQTLSMRANDIIRLGNEIDNIIKLATSIGGVIEIQGKLPQLVDTYSPEGVPNGDLTIYNSLDELVAIHAKLNDIITVYHDIKEGGSKYIETVSLNLRGDNTIGTVAADLQKAESSNVKLVGQQMVEVTTVAHNLDKVVAVYNNTDKIANVALTVIPNIDELLQVDAKAEIAANKAAVATSAAATAVAKSNEIKSVSVGNTVTGAPGTNASVIYNPTDGKFTFVVPRGQKGDKGEAFTVNAVGPASNKSLYDSMQSGFSFLAVDTNMIYFKASGSVGDWTLGSPFGKGDKGDPGEDGNSIVQITFKSSTHASNLPAQTGSIDTYKVAFSDGSFNTFTVYNGKDNDIGADSITTLTNKTINSVSNTIGANHVHIAVVNNTGSLIVKGTPVRKAATQSNPNYLCIEPCNNNSQFAIGIAYESIEGTPDTLGRIVTTGSVTDVNTELWQVGDTLYVGSNGRLTNNKPSTPAYQICGVVQVKSVTEGVILVNMNDIYNTSSVNLVGDQEISDVKTFTSTIVGNISGNAGTSTKLRTARNIAGIPFDGTANINIPFANISSTPTTLGGYKITDAYTVAAIGTLAEFTANLN